MEKDIRVVEFELDEILGELRRISLVSQPAIDEDFLLFNQSTMKFQTIDAEKKVLTGPAMRADINIPRRDANGELYYGFFSKDTVRRAAEMFFKRGANMNNTNLEHEFEIDGVYVFESWIVEDPLMDKAVTLGFTDIRKGDWFVSMKIENEMVWNNYLKTGLIKGFSVEIRAKEKEVEILSKMKAILTSDKNDEVKYESLLELLK
jgi:hypothetical protein